MSLRAHMCAQPCMIRFFHGGGVRDKPDYKKCMCVHKCVFEHVNECVSVCVHVHMHMCAYTNVDVWALYANVDVWACECKSVDMQKHEGEHVCIKQVNHTCISYGLCT